MKIQLNAEQTKKLYEMAWPELLRIYKEKKRKAAEAEKEKEKPSED